MKILVLLLMGFAVGFALACGLNTSTPINHKPFTPDFKASSGACTPAVPAHLGVCVEHKYGTPFKKTTPLGQKGIDISVYQGHPNFPYAKAHGLVFVLNQTGDGSSYYDPNFVSNWKTERSLGLYHGAYIFLRPGCASCQANAIYGSIQAAGGQDSKAFYPVLDAEVEGAYNEVCPVAQDLKLKLHTAVIVYTSPGLWPGLGACGTLSWPAEWGTSGYAFSPWTSYIAQQYSGTGSFPGVGGEVDLDVNHGLLAIPPAPKVTKAQKKAKLYADYKFRTELRRDRLTRHCSVPPKYGGGRYHEICATWTHQGQAVNKAIRVLHKEGIY